MSHRTPFMKRLGLIVILIYLVPAFAVLHAKTHVKTNPNAKVEKTQGRVKQLLAQMTQLTLEAISKPSAETAPEKFTKHEIDPIQLKNAIVQHHVGSILNVTTAAFSQEHWHAILRQIQEVATKQTRLKIPVIYGIDAIHGATYTQGATLFPQAIGMAATWNRDLLKKEGEITSNEVFASGIPWNFYPVMDVARQPLWPRVYETYGEDTYLASQLGSAYLSGHHHLQQNGQGGVATCLKHFVGYGFPWSGKDRTPALLTERMLRETFLPPFQSGVQAGAQTVMINSSSIDGIPGHANRHLLIDILRGELGFKGFTVSDWQDIARLHTRDRVAASPEDAVQMAVMAGVDMSMVPLDYSFYDILIQLVRKGKVPMSRIDEAVSRILKVKFDLGLFENPIPNDGLKASITGPDRAKTKTEANLAAARESITLLKNENSTLPLSRNAKVLIAGPNANSLSALNGGWTFTWQGDEESVNKMFAPHAPTLLQALQNKIDARNLVYESDPQQAVSAAASVDTIILCLGEKAYTETPGNIDDLTLDASQLELAQALEKTGKPVVIVLTEGRPRIIRPIVDGARAVVMAYYPGMEGGKAIADVLFGDENPSGRLPFTYPKFNHALIAYDHTPMEEAEGNTYSPQWPFGFGLSYTSFAYSNLELDQTELSLSKPLHLKVTVTNTGKTSGKEVVQLYLTDLYASVARPVKQLRGFEKVTLAPGEAKTVEFTLEPEAFSFVNAQLKRVTEPGEFVVSVGNLKQTVALKR